MVADNLADASGAGVHYNVAVLVADGTCAACAEGASHSWRVRTGC